MIKLQKVGSRRLVCPECGQTTVELMTPIGAGHLDADDDELFDVYRCRKSECCWFVEVLADDQVSRELLRRLHEVNGRG